MEVGAWLRETTNTAIMSLWSVTGTETKQVQFNIVYTAVSRLARETRP